MNPLGDPWGTRCSRILSPLVVLLLVMAAVTTMSAGAINAAPLEPRLTFLDEHGVPQTLPNVTFPASNAQITYDGYYGRSYRRDIAVVNTYRCMHGLSPEHWLRTEPALTAYAEADLAQRLEWNSKCLLGTSSPGIFNSWEPTQLVKIKNDLGIDAAHTNGYSTVWNPEKSQCQTYAHLSSINTQTAWTQFFHNYGLTQMTWDNPRAAPERNQTMFLWKDAHVWGRHRGWRSDLSTQYVGTIPNHGRRAPHDVLNEQDTWLEMVPGPDTTRNYTTCEAAVENFYNQHFGLDVESGVLTDGTVTRVFTTNGQLTRPWFHTNVTIDGQNDPANVDLIPGKVYNMTYITPTTRPSFAPLDSIALCTFGDISLHIQAQTRSTWAASPWAIRPTTQCLYQNENWSREMNGTYTTPSANNNIPKGVVNTFVVNGMSFTQHWRSVRIPYDVVNSDLAQICIATGYALGGQPDYTNNIQAGFGTATNGIPLLHEAPFESQCISALKLRAFEWRITSQGTCAKVNVTQTCGPMVRRDITYECVDRRVDQVVADEQCRLHADPQYIPPCDEYVDECSALGGPCEDAQNVEQFDTCGECNRGYNGTLCDYQYQWYAIPFEDMAEEECVNIFANQTCGQQQKVRDVTCALIHNDTSVEEQIVDVAACTALVDIIGDAPEETALCSTAIAGTCDNAGMCSTTTGQCECQHGFNGTTCQQEYHWHATPFEEIAEEECVEVYTAQTCGPKQKVRDVGCVLLDPQQNNTIVEEDVDIAQCVHAIDLIGPAPEQTQLCNTTMGLCGNGGVCTTGRCECTGGGKYSGLYCEQNNNAMQYGQQYHIAFGVVISLISLLVTVGY